MEEKRTSQLTIYGQHYSDTKIRDSTKERNYRLISVNMDADILNKNISKLNSAIYKTIHCDRVEGYA